MSLDDLEHHLPSRSFKTFDRASKHSQQLLDRTATAIADYMAANDLNPDDACFVVVGSVGRREALDASDLDLIPVLKTSEAHTQFESHDQTLRESLSAQLGVKVSKGDHLTKRVDIDTLTSPESIGGDIDDVNALTKRVLILTEGIQAGGRFTLDSVRRKILDAYAGAERTRGRHVLSLCNDVARYYRTLCIEYKAKVDTEAKDWCTRNMKLRHSRKLWYFATLMSMAAVSARNPRGEAEFTNDLMAAFDRPPITRLFGAIEDRLKVRAARILERFAWFLEFMSSQPNRDALAKVDHSNRHLVSLENPFSAAKLNSDLMHREMVDLVEDLDGHLRERVFDWFLL